MNIHINEWKNNHFLYHFIVSIAEEYGFKPTDVLVTPLVRMGYALYEHDPSDIFYQEEKHILYFGSLKTTEESIVYFGSGREENNQEPQYIGKDYEGIFRAFRSNKNELRYVFNGYRIVLPKFEYPF